ncbi:hypothetical protein [Bradyrhizobium elkanii]|uniref:hypothetical protein n=1 Tax=Bradyrhizobium elkanii TaxID=29448 RepID=UPI001AE99143|nr:hypothetical protein [Bradyrhizobium elkanii]MBP2434177.1 hypothetical protein [Bradyrhizobium elkanii]WLA88911.1 hypothetical protein QNJ96_27885 [Bradyrhizobium elkanii]
MDILKHFQPFIVFYAVGFLFTAGHLYRGFGGRIGLRQAAYAIAWPIWWPVAQGIGPLLDVIDETLMGTDGRLMLSLGLGLFSAGHYLSTNWSGCSGAVACTGVLMKSAALLVPPVNVGYWIWVVSQVA